jgi:hypothetical protein
MRKPKTDILQGTLAMLVLKTLAVHDRLHGYAITSIIQRTWGDLLRVEEGHTTLRCTVWNRRGGCARRGV